MEEPSGPPAAPPPAGGGQKRKRRRRGKGSGGGNRNVQHWMIVSSPENVRRTAELGYTIQGVKEPMRKRAEAIRTGDRLLYYVTGRMAFAAAATVTGEMFEDREPIWRSARPEEVYPWRIRIRSDAVLEEADWVAARDLAFRLEYVSKWAPEDWSLAFQGHLHQLPRTDFNIVEAEFHRIRRRRRGPRPPRRQDDRPAALPAGAGDAAG